MAVLKINGVTMPEILADGYNISKNKIWSSNSGRVKSGKAVGTIIAIKTTLDITFAPLTEEEVAIIDNQVSDATKPFQKVEYWDERGNDSTKVVYFGDVTYSTSEVINGKKIFNGVSISGIEQ